MFRRLLSCLLIACLAAPAMAATQHCQPQAQASAAGHGAHQAHHGDTQPTKKQAGAKQHDCIGCIAPYSGALTLVNEAHALTVQRNTRIFAQLDGLTAPPALPPPRA